MDEMAILTVRVPSVLKQQVKVILALRGGTLQSVVIEAFSIFVEKASDDPEILSMLADLGIVLEREAAE